MDGFSNDPFVRSIGRPPDHIFMDWEKEGGKKAKDVWMEGLMHQEIHMCADGRMNGWSDRWAGERDSNYPYMNSKHTSSDDPYCYTAPKGLRDTHVHAHTREKL